MSDTRTSETPVKAYEWQGDKIKRNEFTDRVNHFLTQSGDSDGLQEVQKKVPDKDEVIAMIKKTISKPNPYEKFVSENLYNQPTHLHAGREDYWNDKAPVDEKVISAIPSDPRPEPWTKPQTLPGPSSESGNWYAPKPLVPSFGNPDQQKAFEEEVDYDSPSYYKNLQSPTRPDIKLPNEGGSLDKKVAENNQYSRKNQRTIPIDFDNFHDSNYENQREYEEIPRQGQNMIRRQYSDARRPIMGNLPNRIEAMNIEQGKNTSVAQYFLQEEGLGYRKATREMVSYVNEEEPDNYPYPLQGGGTLTHGSTADQNPDRPKLYTATITYYHNYNEDFPDKNLQQNTRLRQPDSSRLAALPDATHSTMSDSRNNTSPQNVDYYEHDRRNNAADSFNYPVSTPSGVPIYSSTYKNRKGSNGKDDTRYLGSSVDSGYDQGGRWNLSPPLSPGSDSTSPVRTVSTDPNALHHYYSDGKVVYHDMYGPVKYGQAGANRNGDRSYLVRKDRPLDQSRSFESTVPERTGGDRGGIDRGGVAYASQGRRPSSGSYGAREGYTSGPKYVEGGNSVRLIGTGDDYASKSLKRIPSDQWRSRTPDAGTISSDRAGQFPQTERIDTGKGYRSLSPPSDRNAVRDGKEFRPQYTAPDPRIEVQPMPTQRDTVIDKRAAGQDSTPLGISVLGRSPADRAPRSVSPYPEGIYGVSGPKAEDEFSHRISPSGNVTMIAAPSDSTRLGIRPDRDVENNGDQRYAYRPQPDIITSTTISQPSNRGEVPSGSFVHSKDIDLYEANQRDSSYLRRKSGDEMNVENLEKARARSPSIKDRISDSISSIKQKIVGTTPNDSPATTRKNIQTTEPVVHAYEPGSGHEVARRESLKDKVKEGWHDFKDKVKGGPEHDSKVHPTPDDTNVQEKGILRRKPSLKEKIGDTMKEVKDKIKAPFTDSPQYDSDNRYPDQYLQNNQGPTSPDTKLIGQDGGHRLVRKDSYEMMRERQSGGPSGYALGAAALPAGAAAAGAFGRAIVHDPNDNKLFSEWDQGQGVQPPNRLYRDAHEPSSYTNDSVNATTTPNAYLSRDYDTPVGTYNSTWSRGGADPNQGRNNYVAPTSNRDVNVYAGDQPITSTQQLTPKPRRSLKDKFNDTFDQIEDKIMGPFTSGTHGHDKIVRDGNHPTGEYINAHSKDGTGIDRNSGAAPYVAAGVTGATLAGGGYVAGRSPKNERSDYPEGESFRPRRESIKEKITEGWHDLKDKMTGHKDDEGSTTMPRDTYNKHDQHTSNISKDDVNEPFAYGSPGRGSIKDKVVGFFKHGDSPKVTHASDSGNVGKSPHLGRESLKDKITDSFDDIKHKIKAPFSSSGDSYPSQSQGDYYREYHPGTGSDVKPIVGAAENLQLNKRYPSDTYSQSTDQRYPYSQNISTRGQQYIPPATNYDKYAYTDGKNQYPSNLPATGYAAGISGDYPRQTIGSQRDDVIIGNPLGTGLAGSANADASTYDPNIEGNMAYPQKLGVAPQFYHPKYDDFGNFPLKYPIKPKSRDHSRDSQKSVESGGGYKNRSTIDRSPENMGRATELAKQDPRYLYGASYMGPSVNVLHPGQGSPQLGRIEQPSARNVEDRSRHFNPDDDYYSRPIVGGNRPQATYRGATYDTGRGGSSINVLAHDQGSPQLARIDRNIDTRESGSRPAGSYPQSGYSPFIDTHGDRSRILSDNQAGGSGTRYPNSDLIDGSGSVNVIGGKTSQGSPELRNIDDRDTRTKYDKKVAVPVTDYYATPSSVRNSNYTGDSSHYSTNSSRFGDDLVRTPTRPYYTDSYNGPSVKPYPSNQDTSLRLINNRGSYDREPGLVRRGSSQAHKDFIRTHTRSVSPTRARASHGDVIGYPHFIVVDKRQDTTPVSYTDDFGVSTDFYKLVLAGKFNDPDSAFPNLKYLPEDEQRPRTTSVSSFFKSSSTPRTTTGTSGSRYETGIAVRPGLADDDYYSQSYKGGPSAVSVSLAPTSGDYYSEYQTNRQPYRQDFSNGRTSTTDFITNTSSKYPAYKGEVNGDEKDFQGKTFVDDNIQNKDYYRLDQKGEVRSSYLPDGPVKSESIKTSESSKSGWTLPNWFKSDKDAEKDREGNYVSSKSEIPVGKDSDVIKESVPNKIPVSQKDKNDITFRPYDSFATSKADQSSKKFDSPETGISGAYVSEWSQGRRAPDEFLSTKTRDLKTISSDDDPNLYKEYTHQSYSGISLASERQPIDSKIGVTPTFVKTEKYPEQEDQYGKNFSPTIEVSKSVPQSFAGQDKYVSTKQSEALILAPTPQQEAVIEYPKATKAQEEAVVPESGDIKRKGEKKSKKFLSKLRDSFSLDKEGKKSSSDIGGTLITPKTTVIPLTDDDSFYKTTTVPKMTIAKSSAVPDLVLGPEKMTSERLATSVNSKDTFTPLKPSDLLDYGKFKYYDASGQSYDKVKDPYMQDSIFRENANERIAQDSDKKYKILGGDELQLAKTSDAMKNVAAYDEEGPNSSFIKGKGVDTLLPVNKNLSSIKSDQDHIGEWKKPELSADGKFPYEVASGSSLNKDIGLQDSRFYEDLKPEEARQLKNQAGNYTHGSFTNASLSKPTSYKLSSSKPKTESYVTSSQQTPLRDEYEGRKPISEDVIEPSLHRSCPCNEPHPHKLEDHYKYADEDPSFKTPLTVSSDKSPTSTTITNLIKTSTPSSISKIDTTEADYEIATGLINTSRNSLVQDSLNFKPPIVSNADQSDKPTSDKGSTKIKGIKDNFKSLFGSGGISKQMEQSTSSTTPLSGTTTTYGTSSPFKSNKLDLKGKEYAENIVDDSKFEISRIAANTANANAMSTAANLKHMSPSYFTSGTDTSKKDISLEKNVHFDSSTTPDDEDVTGSYEVVSPNLGSEDAFQRLKRDVNQTGEKSKESIKPILGGVVGGASAVGVAAVGALKSSSDDKGNDAGLPKGLTEDRIDLGDKQKKVKKKNSFSQILTKGKKMFESKDDKLKKKRIEEESTLPTTPLSTEQQSMSTAFASSSIDSTTVPSSVEFSSRDPKYVSRYTVPSPFDSQPKHKSELRPSDNATVDDIIHSGSMYMASSHASQPPPSSSDNIATINDSVVSNAQSFVKYKSASSDKEQTLGNISATGGKKMLIGKDDGPPQAIESDSFDHKRDEYKSDRGSKARSSFLFDQFSDKQDSDIDHDQLIDMAAKPIRARHITKGDTGYETEDRDYNGSAEHSGDSSVESPSFYNKRQYEDADTSQYPTSTSSVLMNPTQAEIDLMKAEEHKGDIQRKKKGFWLFDLLSGHTTDDPNNYYYNTDKNKGDFPINEEYNKYLVKVKQEGLPANDIIYRSYEGGVKDLGTSTTVTSPYHYDDERPTQSMQVPTVKEKKHKF